ncbi:MULTISPECIES: GGDEF domain-containing protein [Halomonas]|uniref:GGDEF domain-containing protein n=1 Tax=Halomonas TaxID=2745 RepID=UPI001C946804|nr:MULTISPECIES: diguanylate cyclase [Halomonas]MBY5931120.1 diguanylate cyclase [Halomonas sp. DP8Y7-3]MBY6030472.1 diguanylate cyclase [Halomonas sp. DP8Y7-1]MBY6209271.1 diguanylate cyclase [Halomonas sp. DP3Y7-2]MBY6229426.1 diguanylate cyclase [Halomonas sp. DP3Y7-1]MCA0917511.1 diguanylate cyclase [Halomonas denitrificans]
MTEHPQWRRSWRLLADLLAALLLAAVALWHYLIGQYEYILLPAVLCCLVGVIAYLDARRNSRLTHYLLLICACLMLYDQALIHSTLDPIWTSLPIALVLLLLPLGPALVLSCLALPLWLFIHSQMTPDVAQVISMLTFLACCTLASWEHLRQRDLARATDPSDADCDALNHATLHERLTGELERAQHLDQRLAVVILHLPQLEVASEQHGSRLQLSQLDQLCRAVHLHCRDHDILGRHCADTFWLILPNTTESGALLVTKRLEQALSEVRLADLGPLTLRSQLCALKPEEDWQVFLERLQRRTQTMTAD